VVEQGGFATVVQRDGLDVRSARPIWNKSMEVLTFCL
jgi:hypothetical protein